MPLQTMQVVIGRVGWVDEVVLNVSALTFSRKVDGPGSLRCQVPINDLYDLGYDLHVNSVSGNYEPIKGHWIRVSHTTAGQWGGVITQTRVDGYWVELTAESFHVLLRQRTISLDYGIESLPPGSLALRAIKDVQTHEYTHVWKATADESGEPMDYEWRGGDIVDDVLRELVRASGHQWRVNPDRSFEWRVRLGEDKSGDVCLVEGVTLVNVESSGDLWTMANEITGMSSDARWSERTAYVQDDESSIRAYGRRFQKTLTYPYATRSTIVPHVRDDLKQLRYPAEAIRADILDDGESWEDVREGDIISVILPSMNVLTRIEIVTQQFDFDSGLMSIAGRILVQD